MIYLLDVKYNRFLYVSDHLSHRIGLTTKEIERMNSDFYYDHLSEENRQLFSKSTQACKNFLKSISHEQRDKFIMFVNMCMIKNGKNIYISHKFIPLSFDELDNVQFVLCISDRAHYSEAQIEVFIKNIKQHTLHIYDFNKHNWREEPAIRLSEAEKEVLDYSSHGYSIRRIAHKMNKSEDTIKSYRRSIFSKMAIDNINEAISIASFYNIS